jgi:hypothetical protein
MAVPGMCVSPVRTIQVDSIVQQSPEVVGREADDPPEEDRLAPESYLRDRGAQSTGATMPFSNFDWPILQRRASIAHMAMSSTSHALLFGDSQSASAP